MHNINLLNTKLILLWIALILLLIPSIFIMIFVIAEENDRDHKYLRRTAGILTCIAFIILCVVYFLK